MAYEFKDGFGYDKYLIGRHNNKAVQGEDNPIQWIQKPEVTFSDDVLQLLTWTSSLRRLLIVSYGERKCSAFHFLAKNKVFWVKRLCT